MLSFWARYVLAKEKQGILRENVLDSIEGKLGTTKRQELETELQAYEQN